MRKRRGPDGMAPAPCQAALAPPPLAASIRRASQREAHTGDRHEPATPLTSDAVAAGGPAEGLISAVSVGVYFGNPFCIGRPMVMPKPFDGEPAAV